MGIGPIKRVDRSGYGKGCVAVKHCVRMMAKCRDRDERCCERGRCDKMGESLTDGSGHGMPPNFFVLPNLQ